MPACRAKASSTPFTNLALAEVPNRSASRTASWIATRGGVSPFMSSAAPSLSTERSIAPMRSRRQFVVRSASRESSSLPASETSRTSSPASRRSSGVTARSSQTCVATRSRFFPPRISHAYSACSARARARDSIRIVWFEAIQEVHHLERCDGRVPSLVAVGAAGPRFSLFVGVAGQHAEANGGVRLRARVRQTARCFAGDVFEVRGLAADYGADGDDPIVALAGEEPSGSGRKLPGTRNPNYIDVLERDAVLDQCLESPVDQLFYD